MKNLFIAFILLFTQNVAGQNYSEVAGEWSGAIEISGQDLNIDFIFNYLDNELDGTLDIPQQMAFNLPVEFIKAEGDSLVFQFHTGMGEAVFKGTWNRAERSITGTFEQMNDSYPFSIIRKDGEKDNQNRGISGEEIVIPTRQGQASGTLLLTEEPSPLVILLSGSGSQDRDETVAGFSVFSEIANLLYQNGVSSFRYDDRGVGNSTGEADATLPELAEDLEQITGYLSDNYESRVSNIILMGHSQGGLVAAIAAQEVTPDGIIFMGAPFLRGDEVINQQIKTISEAQGITEEIVDQNMEFQQRIYEVIRTEGKWDEVEQDLYNRLESQINELPQQQREALGDMDAFIKSQINRQLSAAKTDWFKSFIEYEPAGDIGELSMPMLALFGENDTQVIETPNRQAAEKLKSEAGLNLEIITIDSANHLFQKSESGLPSEYGMLDNEFTEGFQKALIEWLNTLRNSKQ